MSGSRYLLLFRTCTDASAGSGLDKNERACRINKRSRTPSTDHTQTLEGSGSSKHKHLEWGRYKLYNC